MRPLLLFLACGFAPLLAQESPSPTETPVTTSTVSPTPSASPVSTSTPRSIRISFLPPPLEGTVSLGIYNSANQLVRILHQEASFDEFTIGADALQTKWDGTNDDGLAAPPGKYHARGFLIANMKIEELPASESPAPVDSSTPVRVKLVANPLEDNERPSVDLTAGADDENACIQTDDGLPLVTVCPTGTLDFAATLQQRSDKSLHLVLRGPTTRDFKITGITKMMSFDAGEFQLK